MTLSPFLEANDLLDSAIVSGPNALFTQYASRDDQPGDVSHFPPSEGERHE